jgi:hypothetical protein
LPVAFGDRKLIAGQRGMVLAVAAGVLAATSTAAQQVEIGRGSVAETVATLKPGQYVWQPEVAPDGPLLLIVNTAHQRAMMFRNGVPIAASTVSTGKPGYSTPTGVFTVLQKQVEHYSTTYDNAPMPYMQRLTWQGVALHAGSLPGYPASHGCIRLPAGFAKLLYGVTSLGMTVVITDKSTQPRIAPSPQLVAIEGSATPSGEAPTWDPAKSPEGPVSIVVSTADRRAIVLRNGIIIGSAPVMVSGAADGTWAYALRNVDGTGQHWMRLSLSADDKAEQAVPRTEWQRFTTPDWFRNAVTRIVAPGTTIVVTGDSLVNSAAATPVTLLEQAD